MATVPDEAGDWAGAGPGGVGMRGGSAVLGAVLVAAVLTGCSSSYEYVGGTSASKGAYFKVPASWSTFSAEPDEVVEGRPVPLTRPSADTWSVLFDAHPEPSAAHLAEVAPAYPVGEAAVLTFDAQDRDVVSLAVLRSLATDDRTDPLETHGNGTVEVVRFEGVSNQGGLVGERVVFNRQVEPGVWVTTDHTAMWNPVTGTLYRFVVTCASACFLDNQGEIDEVVASWQVRR